MKSIFESIYGYPSDHQVIVESSESQFLKHKAGDRVKVKTSEHPDGIDAVVVGLAFVASSKIYNKSAAKWKNYTEFYAAVEDDYKDSLRAPSFKDLLTYGYHLVDTKKVKAGEFNLGLILYQDGKTSVGYSRTMTVFESTAGKLQMVNDKHGPYAVKSIS